MIKKRNWLKLIIFTITVVLFSVVLLKKSIIDITKILESGNDFQYNLMSMSAVIGGFLFTGISILISAVDKERIHRLWKNNYLDNLYRAAFCGMFSNVLTIIIAFILICKDFQNKTTTILVYLEIILVILGLAFFVWCMKFLISIISKLKDD